MQTWRQRFWNIVILIKKLDFISLLLIFFLLLQFFILILVTFLHLWYIPWCWHIWLGRLRALPPSIILPRRDKWVVRFYFKIVSLIVWGVFWYYWIFLMIVNDNLLLTSLFFLFLIPVMGLFCLLLLIFYIFFIFHALRVLSYCFFVFFAYNYIQILPFFKYLWRTIHFLLNFVLRLFLCVRQCGSNCKTLLFYKFFCCLFTFHLLSFLFKELSF